MDTGQALLRSVLASPDDDLPRLVYADWLDENGQPERAEFIRIQVALAKVLPAEVEQQLLAGGVQQHLDRISDLLADPVQWPWVCRQLRRLGELYDADAAVVLETSHLRPGGGEHLRWGFRRGFVHTVRCRLADWIGGECWPCLNGFAGPRPNCPACHGEGRIIGIGPAVVAAHPCERVELTDREPWELAGGEQFQWYDGGSEFVRALDVDRVHGESDLPSEVFDLLAGEVFDTEGDRFRRYASESAALDAISTVLLAHAKSAR